LKVEAGIATGILVYRDTASVQTIVVFVLACGLIGVAARMA
jgi:hypothetical protein